MTVTLEPVSATMISMLPFAILETNKQTNLDFRRHSTRSAKHFVVYLLSLAEGYRNRYKRREFQ